MTNRQQDKKQYTVPSEETLSGCYLPLLGSVHFKWSSLKVNDTTIHGHSHSMDM